MSLLCGAFIVDVQLVLQMGARGARGDLVRGHDHGPGHQQQRGHVLSRVLVPAQESTAEEKELKLLRIAYHTEICI